MPRRYHGAVPAQPSADSAQPVAAALWSRGLAGGTRPAPGGRMGPNYEDELSPEQMAAIQRERNRALYDQAQMQQMGAAAAAQEAYPMAQHAEGVQQAPVGVPRPAAFNAPAGAGSPSPHGGAVADAHADAMQMGYGNDVQRQITSKPGEAPRRLITSKPEEAAAPQRQITSKPGEAPRRLITSK